MDRKTIWKVTEGERKSHSRITDVTSTTMSVMFRFGEERENERPEVRVTDGELKSLNGSRKDRIPKVCTRRKRDITKKKVRNVSSEELEV